MSAVDGARRCRSLCPLGRVVLVVLLAAAVASCGKRRSDEGAAVANRPGNSAQGLYDAAGHAVPDAVSGGVTAAVAADMVWIPPGTVRAGTPPESTPRIADEELPGTPIALGGFYIDRYPYPNEAGAIPTSNVTRDDARKACDAKGKRLCTEFEWERACKGPESTTYEYGDTYRADVCGTGVSLEQAARRPTAERVACKSAFGVADMHGGVWEWTDSPWNRGASGNRDLGVLRGGNAVAGELVGRCANALGRAPTAKNATMGFRCCAGARNARENDLVVTPRAALEHPPTMASLSAGLVPFAEKRWGAPFVIAQSWTWHPVANEELVIVTGCAARSKCGVLIGRAPARGEAIELGAADSGVYPAEVVQLGEPAHLRMRGIDTRGAFLREITYSYGRVDTGSGPRR